MSKRIQLNMIGFSDETTKGCNCEVLDLSDYAKKTDVPTKVSQLENDNDYITSYSADYRYGQFITKGWLSVNAVLGQDPNITSGTSPIALEYYLQYRTRPYDLPGFIDGGATINGSPIYNWTSRTEQISIVIRVYVEFDTREIYEIDGKFYLYCFHYLFNGHTSEWSRTITKIVQINTTIV